MAPYTLYSAATPNGWKTSIVLEELGVAYDLKTITLMEGEQKQDWFLKINPNGRIPALVDHDEGDFPVFESGAIMCYLAEKHPEKNLLPKDLKKKAEVMSWLMFQMGGVGPMMGQANMFVRYTKDRIPFAIQRYVAETDRLLGVLDRHLKDHDYLAAGQYSLADIANYSWVHLHDYSGVSVEDKPHLQAWMERVGSRPAVKRGLEIPVSQNPIAKVLSDPEKNKEAIERLKLIADDNITAKRTVEKLQKLSSAQA